MAAAGATFYLDKGCDAVRFDARAYFPQLAQSRSNAANEALFRETQKRIASGKSYRAVRGLEQE